MSVLQVGCFKYRPPGGQYRSTFGPQTVNVLRNMVARHLNIPHEFYCVTDDAEGIDKDIRIIPMWQDYAKVPNPSQPQGPSCYPRLKLWSDEARSLIGERFVCLDLDMVIMGDITGMFTMPDDVVIADGISLERPGYRHAYCRYNGSMLMMTAGARRQVWDRFDPKTSPRTAHMAGSKGTDQGWFSYVLGAGEKTWTTKDGVYSYMNHIATKGGVCPKDARVVLFHGRVDPWSPEARRLAWVREQYQ